MATKPNGPFDRAGRRKKLIEMERRHIREGEARVAVQEEIVSHLNSSGGPESKHVLTARAVLVAFRKSLAFARQRLGDLEREQRDKTPEPN
jgi:hypothetical protein